MLNRRVFLATLAVVSLGFPRLAREVSAFGTSAGDPTVAEQQTKPQTPQKETTILIAAIGDLQKTGTAELVLLSRPDNGPEREKIIAQVAKEKPDLLLLLGDQVSDAASATDWSFFDQVTRPIANIPTLAVRGNHDYSQQDSRMAERECHARWPETRNRPHKATIGGSIALIGVDTNLDLLTAAEARRQQTEYVKALAEYDKDPTIRAVIVFGHHPPYTNSFLGANQGVIDQFAMPFLKAEKTKLFLAGHVHSYERFTHNKGEKFFVTSGGGGGPRRTIDVSSSRPFHNDVNKLGELRPFNFLKLKVSGNSIVGQAMLLQKKGFVVGDQFSVKLPAPPPSTPQLATPAR